MLARDLIDAVALELNDRAHDRWLESDLLGFLNSALAQLVILRPEATATTQPTRLSPGVLQRLPADGQQLLALTRNLGPDGRTPGRAITPTSRAMLDACEPNWPAKPGSTSVRHVLADPTDPRVYRVYPPVHTSSPVYAELTYSRLPTEIQGADDGLPVAPVYRQALEHWMLYRAYAVETESTDMANRAVGHYQAFFRSLGTQEPAA